MTLHEHPFVDDEGETHYESCPNIWLRSDEDRAQTLVEFEELRSEGGVHWWITDLNKDPVVGTLGQSARPGQLLCRQVGDYETVTSNREIFDEWALLGLACNDCNSWLHA